MNNCCLEKKFPKKEVKKKEKKKTLYKEAQKFIILMYDFNNLSFFLVNED